MVNSFTPSGGVAMEMSGFWRIAIDREGLMVRLIRTELPYSELSEIGESFLVLERALADVDRKQYLLLCDLREGPRRNDAEFEAHIGRFRKSLVLPFKRTAFLVKTASGLLQVKRHIQQDGAIRAAVFLDEIQAMRHLERRD